MVNEKHLNRYFQSIIEREEIFIRKELLKLPQKDWTDVEVYKQYRFCNVHRCYDKTYKLIQNFSDLIGGIHPGLRTVLRWTACNPLISFLFNKYTTNPEWQDAIDMANDDNPGLLFRMILACYDRGEIPLVSGSFIVKRYGNDFEEMIAYYKAGTLFDEKFVTPYTTEGKTTTTEKAVKFFKENAPWCADFGAYCIVSDWIYLMPEMFTDLYTWTAYGPGAYRGICKVVGVDISKRDYLKCLQQLRQEWEHRAPEMFDQILTDIGLTRDRLNELCKERGYNRLEDLLLAPTMLDVEHWLCEYAKYARGWAKKKYRRQQWNSH